MSDVYATTEQDIFRPQIHLALYKKPNITGVIHNLAACLTDRIRHNYNDTFANGTALRPVMFVRVNWP
jgi:hypothetical protein